MVFVAVAMLAPVFLGGCSSVKIAGRVAVKGSEPHTYLVLVSNGQDYKLVGPLRDEIWKSFQGRRIRVRGRIVREARGPGFPAELEVLEILGVEPPEGS